MREKGYCLILLMVFPLLTGCWSRTEVNDMAMIMGVAIDKAKDGKIQLTVQIAVPKGLGGASGEGSGSQKPSVLIPAKGETIMEAYRFIQEKVPREIFFAHTRVIIIGEELARDGVSPILDFFSRYRQSHLRYYLLCTKGKALDILKSSPRLESIMAEEIREQEKTGVGVKTAVRDFLKRMLTDGEEAVTAQISTLPLEAKDEEEEGPGTSKSAPAIKGAAVFQGDQLVGWLNDKEARGILWIRNEIESGIIIVSVPEEKGGGMVAAQISKGSTNIKPIFYNDNKIKMKIKAYGEVEIFENTSTIDLSDPKEITFLQSLFEKDVKTRIQLTLDKAQKELKSDIFGFGQAVYRTDSKKWETYYKERWGTIYPNLEVEIASHITVKGTGFSTKSISLPDS